MAERPDLSAQFSVLARAGLPPSALVTWAPTLWREPRLLVPVDVQALVVTSAAQEEWADVARRLPEGAEPSAGSAPQPGTLAAPPPFTPVTGGRSPGVYLHWALPDALATGTVPHDAGSAPGPAQLGMPVVPNRWLVARIGGGTPRRVAAWVVESDRGLTRPLGIWAEAADPAPGARTPWLQPGSLTAVSGGDPAWAAVLDGVIDRFAVHDDLADLDRADAAGTLSYLVAGWYSDPALDPLAGADAARGFEALLARLRWSIDADALARARASANAAREAATAARKQTGPRATGAEVIATLQVGALNAQVPVPAADSGLVEGATPRIAPGAWSPRQTICHGHVHGVRPDGVGADDRPAASALTAALGSCPEDSFAALLAPALPDPLGGERLAAAFLRGTAGRYDDPDGAVDVDEDLHGAEFVALPGGTRDRGDRLRTGGAADSVLDTLGTAADRRAAGPPRRTRKDGSRTASVRFGLQRKALHIVDDGTPVLEVFEERGRPGPTDSGEPSQAPVRGPAGFRDVEVGLPRMHVPADPVLTLTGAARSLRHGSDTRHTEDGLLACRLTGEPVRRMHGVIKGHQVVAPLGHGGLPPECEELLAEVALTDPFHAAETAQTAAQAAGAAPVSVTNRVFGEIALAASAAAGKKVAWAAAASTMDGTLPSPQATTWWRQPWVPLYLEWELEVDLADDDAAALRAWDLGEVDLEPSAAPGAAPTTTIRSLTGRSLLTPSPASAFADRVRTVLLAEAELDQAGGDLEPATEQALRTLAARSRTLDVTAAALEGLRQWLLGWDDNVARAKGGTPGAAVSPVPARVPRLLRSGAFRLVRARVVDTFGRIVDLTPGLSGVRVAGSLTANGEGTGGAAGVLVPRLTTPARLMLRLVDPAHEDIEAHVDQETGGASPVAGWLLPDPVDHAAELFDAAGAPLGQLIHDPDGPGVLWESAPGRPGPLGAPPPVNGPGDLPLAGVVTGLLRADAQRRAAGLAPETEDLLEEEESPLSAMLRVLDTTAATVDSAAAGTDHLAGLMSRPLALVRALLRIEIGPDEAPPETPQPLRRLREQRLAEVARLEVPVRLGALSRLDDGVLGYFVDDDYGRFHPVAGDVLAAALDSGPRRGLLASGADPAAPGTRPVTSGYVVADPVLRVHPGQTVRLTLVVVAGAAVHATCGLLPRTSVRLHRDWTAEALERIAPSFRVGPVLVDPATIRMPAPGGGGITPTWAHRDTPATWREDPIAAATAEARMAERPAAVQDGWLRLVRGEEEPS
ncbi:hypothetical protein ADK57_18025 [Streptomyces sp. MMG1533]|uniref:hypothetical protein n=1 Tax=Streptomyces sp. MMG1533 TaxID=1415546 RepID=UPI0006AE9DD9|nr:hypothetical protein [Streptomyces sp. MMG1533]KOU66859.1 hypothetical protein ADK57_18025 [Streptomyces sp. MMG1533]